MFPSLLISLMALAAPTPATGPDHPLPVPVATSAHAAWFAKARHVQADGPSISVWMNSTKPYQRSQSAQVYIKTDRDAYVTVVRIDTDGRVRMLFPIDPWDDNFARGGKDLELVGRNNGPAFTVDDDPGVGYVFAIASPDPFTYDHFVLGDHWDYRVIADGRIKGDPYVAVTDFAAQIAPQGNFTYDLASYDVQQHYDYPRFVCYDCHAYTSYAYWNPYLSWCSSFQLVIYDNPFYYPYGAYPYGYGGYYGYPGYIGYPGYYGYYYGYPYNYYGPGVVVGRPLRPPPRYVFKDWNGSGPYVTRVPERPRGADGQWVSERRRTGAEFGGQGSVPTPNGGGGQNRSRNPGTPQGGAGQPGTGPAAGGGRRGSPGGSQPATPNQPSNPNQRGTQGHQPDSRMPQLQDPSNSMRSREPSRQPQGSTDTHSAQPNGRRGNDGPPSWSSELRVREPEPPSGGGQSGGNQSGGDGRRGAELRPPDQSRQGSAPSYRGYNPPRQEAPQGRQAPPQRQSPPPQSQGRGGPPPGASQPRGTGEPQLRRRSP